jgi:glucosamine--fructose-6-phosphate aminotransferase (isomerizing)
MTSVDEIPPAVAGPGAVTRAEIASQPALWAQAVEQAAQVADLLRTPDQRVLVLGCGTSAFVAQSHAALRERAGLGWTDWAYASELPRVDGYDVVVAVTRSGTTSEVHAALDRFAGRARRVVVTAVPDQIADRADDVVDLSWADERSVVQTRFPTSYLALLRCGLGARDAVTAAIEDAGRVLAEPLPIDVAQFDHFVSLGHGWTVGLAHEAALKIRESAQAWAESYPALDYRHGPIAVATDRTMVQVFGEVPDDLITDIQAVGATVLDQPADPLAQLVTAQRVAVQLAAARGLNPDRPRNLTRSVVLDTRAGGSSSVGATP